MKKKTCRQKSFRRKVYSEPQPFLVYYILVLKFQSDQEFKSVILAKSAIEAKEILLKKIRRDYLACEVKRIQAFVVRKNNYKGRRLSDKEWDTLLKIGYPNSRHRLYKFSKDARPQKTPNPHRDENGKWSKGNTPWNKNLKVQMISKTEDGKFKSARDSKGQFTKGITPVIVGAKVISHEQEHSADVSEHKI